MKQVVKRLVFISQKLLEIFFKNLNDRPGDLEQLEKMERSLLSYKDQRGLTPLHKVRGSSLHLLCYKDQRDITPLHKVRRSTLYLLSYKDQRDITPLHKVRGSPYTCSATCTRTNGTSPRYTR